MIKLETFQGHIVLLCKGHYKYPNGDKEFFEALKRIWAIRCGYDYEQTGKDTLSYIAMDMYKILTTCAPNNIPNIMERLHREINDWWGFRPKDMSPIEAIIWHYMIEINNLQIKETKEDGKWDTLIKLPKPMKKVFNKILSGKGEYKDYDLIVKNEK